MSKLTLALLLVAFAVSLPQHCGATNYHEYKKFDPPVPTERVPSKCHVQSERASELSLRQAVGIFTPRLTERACSD